jgi:phospholipase C
MSDNYIGAAMCQARHKTAHPPIPYGHKNAKADPAKLVEEGFKQVRGSLTEGRYLTFELDGYALTNEAAEHGNVTVANSTSMHEGIHQRWILHLAGEQGGSIFNIQSALDSSYISTNQALVESRDDAQVYDITDLGNGQGYSLEIKRPTHPSDDDQNELRKELVDLQMLGVRNGALETGNSIRGWKIFSVTYHS